VRAALHEPAVVRVLPDRQTGARRVPRIHDVPVALGRGADPFEEIEQQCFHGVEVSEPLFLLD